MNLLFKALSSFSCKFKSFQKGRLSKLGALFLFSTGILFALQGSAQTTVTLTSSSAWICPAGVSSVTVECWGAGGGGGGASIANGGGAGGGGGAYSRQIVSVTPGTSYTYTIGTGGAGGAGVNGGTGGSSWFGATTTVLAVGGGGGVANNGASGAGGTVAASVGTTKFAGGAGAAGVSGIGGGGGGSAGSTANGGGGSGVTAGTAGATGGAAGAAGTTTNADNTNSAGIPGGGGGGTRTGAGAAARTGSAGARGQIKLTYTQLTYKSQLVGMSLGSANWCPGETRNVTIQIKNIGTATWTDGTAGSATINVGVKWNTNGTNWTDYYIRTTAGNLAPNATGTYILPITASNNTGAGYTTPLATGTNNLIFDVVYEGLSWFGDNNTGVGPGNVKFTSANQTIGYPSITVGSNPSVCQGVTSASLSYSAPVASPDQYSIDYNIAAESAGFTDVVNAALPASPIILTVPAGAAPGTYNGTLTVRTSANACSSTGVAVAVTVLDNSTIALTSAGGTNSQTVCQNTAISNITYLIGGSGTGATVTGLPTGVTGTYNAATKVFTISGSPSVSGAFSYTVTTTGPCTNTTASGTIDVTEASSISLTSGAGTGTQSVCIDNAITDITYTIGGTSTGASMTAGTLPAGVSGSFDGVSTYTITGTPTVSGIYNYTITTSGVCPVSINGTLTVIANSTLSFSSAVGTDGQTRCINTAITNITYVVGGGGTGAGVTGLPSGVTGAYNATTKVYTISGTPTVSGTFNYTVITTGPCINTSLGGTITVTPNSTLTLSSGSGTNIQTVCQNSAITAITYTVGGSGTGANATGLPGGVTGSYSGGVFTISGTPSGSGTFNYTVTTTGPCVNPSLSGTISVNAQPTGVGVTPATATICVGSSVNLTGSGATTSTGSLVNDNFNGTPTFTGAGTAAGGNSQIFTKETSGSNINSLGTFTSPNGGSFMIAVGSATCGLGTCTSSANTTLTSPVINTTTVASLTLSYNHTYKQANVSGSGTIQISVNGGTSWTTLKTFSTNQGGATSFVSDNIVLSNTYLNQTNLRIRFNFVSSGSGSFFGTHSAWWGVDDVLLNGQLIPFFSWTANTGTGINGLPAGAGTASLANKNITVNPTQTTTYTLTATNPVTSCGVSTATSTVTVNQNSTIAQSSASGSEGQTLCIDNAIADITYSIGGDGTGAAITAGSLPAGVTGSFNDGVFTISGTPTASGVFNYTVTTTGPCVNPSLSGTITVNANSTIGLSSAAGTDAQTVCINTGLTNITYAIGGGGTGASITAGALPAGVTGSYNAGVFTISGTPSVSGSFSYTITTAGPCVNNSLSGSIEVTADATISFSSAAGTNGQTVCINTALTDITYSVGGTATGASVTAGSLPAGVTGSFNAGVFTISGTPAESGVFNYTVSATGSSCINPSLSGTITVNANSTISLSSGAGTDGQTICINTALPVITYAIGGDGNGASITAGGLPAGVTGSFSGGVFTISGTPTESGHFPYTVSTTGPCVNVSLTGSVTVNEDATLSLSSAGGTDAQTVCINNSIINIRYAVGGSGTGVSISSGSLPAGVTAAYNISGFTISGTPSESGVFNYTVTTTGPCVNASLSGTITVNANSTISLSSDAGTDAQTVCINTALTNITYAIGGSGTGASITAGVLPAGVTGSFNAGVFTISGTPAESGSFSYTVTTTGPCINNSLSGTIDVTAAIPVSVSITSSDADNSICAGSSVTFSATAVNGGNASYQWLLNGNNVGSDQDTYTTSGLVNGDVVTVVLTSDVTPCATENPATSNAITTTVNENVPVSVSITSSDIDNAICEGASVTFTATPVNGGNPSYQWLLNGNNTGVDQDTYTTTGLVNGDVVSVILTSDLPCTSGNPATSNLITTTVNSTQPVSVSILASSNAICAGSSVTFTATPVNGGANPVYQWYNGVNAIAGAASATYTTAALIDGDQISVVMTSDITPCATGNPATSNIITISVNPLPPTPGAITGITNVCEWIDTNIPVTYSIDPVAGAVSYNWSLPLAGVTLLSGQGTTSITVTFDNTFALTNSFFRVTAQTAFPCSSLPSQLEVQKIVPGIPLAITGPTNVCPYAGQLSNAVYSIAPVANATSYTWTVSAGGTIVNGQGTTSVEVSFLNSFNFGNIQVQANSNCGSRAPRSLSIAKRVPGAPVAISGPTNACSYIGTLSQATYSIAPVQWATSYLWTVPANVNIVSGQGTANLTVTFTPGYTTSLFKVKSIAECANSVDRSLSVTATSYGAPGAITGPVNACPYIGTGVTATYTIRKVPNAPSYNWVVPAGVTVTSHPGGTGVNDTIINVTYNNSFASGTSISVQTTGCFTSTASSLTVNRTSSTTSTPGLISGPTNVCEYMISSANPSGLPATYKIRKVAGASSYIWTIAGGGTVTSHPGGTGVNDTIVEVVFNSNFTAGSMSVVSSNGCGTSSPRTLTLTQFMPGSPGPIDIMQTASCPNRQYTYSISAMPTNTTSMVWTVPAGAIIISGQGTTSITVSYPSTAISGIISAKAYNNCSSSSARNINIKLSVCPTGFAGNGDQPVTGKGIPTDITIETLNVKVFPNPSVNEFNLQVLTSGKEQIYIRILDLQGKQLRQLTVMPYESVRVGADLKAGTYMIEVRQGKNVKTNRVIKF